jgi:hypothetical protein
VFTAEKVTYQLATVIEDTCRISDTVARQDSSTNCPGAKREPRQEKSVAAKSRGRSVLLNYGISGDELLFSDEPGSRIELDSH